MRSHAPLRLAALASSLSLSLLGVAACSEQTVVAPSPNDGSAPDALPADTDAGTQDGAWPGCGAINASFCDELEKSDDPSWTRFVADGGTLEIASGDGVSPPGFLHTVLPRAGTYPSVGVRMARVFDKSTKFDYAAHIRVVRRSPGRVSIHEIVASDVKWRLAIELSSSGDKIVEETGTERRSASLSRQLPENAWVLLRVEADLGLPAKPAVVSLDGTEVATHLPSPPGAQFVTIYAGQRPASAEAGEGIVDIDNIVVQRSK